MAIRLHGREASSAARRITAARILEEAVARGGTVSADDLRGEDPTTSLKGHAAGLTRTLTRALQEGWLPEGIESPVQGIGPGYGKVQGYRVHADLLPLFRAAVLSQPSERRTRLSTEITDSNVTWDAALASKTLGVYKLTTDLDAASILLQRLAETGLITETTPGNYHRPNIRKN
ncbi:hypothetical protein K353_06706 [Kitasatospora sp. SolWspMP-SS2h]|uniref:hypothetical protein n=1 Tax=Kitasatospora sp. SolWspMP-SS2h TaxID=1305729 RepID=UPI000DBF4006|nr:hypothetical protein [Kitasatospora sp. SolWspMP-SS2h]RAJ28536.1 hypothetical protein K353_06706 [Kitasatospora sp. SolWspMP-SS2h]